MQAFSLLPFPRGAGLTLLSVYSIAAICFFPYQVQGSALLPPPSISSTPYPSSSWSYFLEHVDMTPVQATASNATAYLRIASLAIAMYEYVNFCSCCDPLNYVINISFIITLPSEYRLYAIQYGLFHMRLVLCSFSVLS